MSSQLLTTTKWKPLIHIHMHIHRQAVSNKEVLYSLPKLFLPIRPDGGSNRDAGREGSYDDLPCLLGKPQPPSKRRNFPGSPSSYNARV